MRQISVGDYSFVLGGGVLAVRGPDESVCRKAEKALCDLIGTEEGAKLLGRARLGAATVQGQQALSELTKRMGLRGDVTEVQKVPWTGVGRGLDYDDDHRQIRALNLPKIYTRTITEFEGMCAAFVFDGIIDDTEIEQLRRWLHAKAEFLSAWPLCDVKELLDAALRDGHVDDAERGALLQLLDSIGASAENCGKAAPSIFDSQPRVEFDRRSFLFTGRLAMGKRSAAEASVAARGGRAVQTVSHRLDYLVVGDLGTDAWQYSRYGRKIEAVMENKRAGTCTWIVCEDDFVAALERTPVSTPGTF